MTSTFACSPLRAAVAAAALALCGWCAQAAPFVAQGLGCGVPPEGSTIGTNTIIKLPGSDGSCPGSVTTERQNFLAGLSSYATEEFASDKSEFSKGYSILGGLGTIDTDVGGGLRYFVDRDSTVNGRWDTTQQAQVVEGNPDVKSGGWFVNAFSTDYIDVTLGANQPDQDAVGFYLTDYGDFGDSVTLELFLDGASLGTQQILGSSTADGSVAFFGVYSSSKFDQFRINFNRSDDCKGGDDFECDLVGLDSLIVGLQNRTGPNIPEPGTLALIGLGLVAARRLSARKTR